MPVDFVASNKWMLIAQWMGGSQAGNVANVLVHHMTKTQIDLGKASALAQLKAWGMTK